MDHSTAARTAAATATPTAAPIAAPIVDATTGSHPSAFASADAPASRFPEGPVVWIRPWEDPVVDELGLDPRSSYVETYWLGVIGPTATWIMRRFAAGFDHAPDGYSIDLDHTATAMGLSFSKGMHSPFGKAVQRCVMFGLAQPRSDGFAVRRRVPPVAHRHLRRLPDDLQAAHAAWQRGAVHVSAQDLERRLIEAGVAPQTAVRATELTIRSS